MGEITVIFDFDECHIGVEENNLDNQPVFQIFPNPNNGTFTLLLNKQMRDFEVKVFDFLGKPIYNEQINGTFGKGHRQHFQLALKHKGVYFVQLYADGFGLSVQKIFVK